MDEKTLGPEDYLKLIDVNRMLTELVDKLFVLLTRYVTFEEMEQAGIVKEMGNSVKASRDILRGGDSNDE